MNRILVFAVVLLVVFLSDVYNLIITISMICPVM